MEKECISCVFGEPKAFATLCTKVSQNFSNTDHCDYWKEKSQEQLLKDKRIREELYRIETAQINAWKEQRKKEEEARRRAWQEQLRVAEKKEQDKIATENTKNYDESLNRTTKNQSNVSSVSKKQVDKKTSEGKYPIRNVKGWVYVIINESLKGLVKIGYTLKDPKLRAKDLQSSGIPNDYKVAYEVLTINPREVEQKIHLSLKKYRDNKEWFKCSISQAVKTVQSIVQEKMYENFYYEQEYLSTRIIHNGEPESQRSNLEIFLKRQRERKNQSA